MRGGGDKAARFCLRKIRLLASPRPQPTHCIGVPNLSLRPLPMPARLRFALGAFALFLLLLALLRAAFALWALTPVQAAELTSGDALSAFVLGARYDAKALAVWLLPLGLLMLPPGTAARQGWRAWLGRALFFLLLLPLLALHALDAGFMRYQHSRLDSSIFLLMRDADTAMDFLWRSYPLLRIALSLVALAACGAWLLWRWWLRCMNAPAAPRRPLTTALWGLAIFLLWALSLHGRLAPTGLGWSEAQKLANPAAILIAQNPAINLFESYNHVPEPLTWDQVALYEREWREIFSLPANPLPPEAPRRWAAPLGTQNVAQSLICNCPALPKDLNIVLVFLESYAASRLPRFGNTLFAAPGFAGIARDGLLFTHFLANGNVTMRGLFATLFSTPDLNREWVSESPALARQSSLINHFAQHRKLYFTGGEVAWAGWGGVLRASIPGLTILERDAFAAPWLNAWGISDRDLLLGANAKLDEQKQPFFAIIQTAQNHRPYSLSSAEAAALPAALPDEATLERNGFHSLEAYKAWLNFDSALAAWAEDARQRPWFARTLFVLLGDHGVSDDVPPPVAQRHWLTPPLNQYRTPLLLWSPAWVKAGESARIGSQMDVLPSLAALFGLSAAPDDAYLGQSLFDGTAGTAPLLLNADQGELGLATTGHLLRWPRTGAENQTLNPTDQAASRKLLALDAAARWIVLRGER